MRIPTLLHAVNAGATHFFLRPWVTNLLALGLVACGGGAIDEVTSTKDPLASYRQQVVTWSACDFGSYQELSSLPPIAAIMSEMQCTKIRVPTDYTNPQGQALEIGVSRVKATPSAFKPELFFFNPGGPGGDGYALPAIFASLWAVDLQDDPVSASQKQQLRQRFDVIGFSPRGLGSSTQLSCPSAQMLEPEDQSLSGRYPANMAAEQRNVEAMARACASNALTPFINSDATARDMDLIREVLGAERLNYMGASYGTWLGLWYAGLFPQRVGRLVLDSSVDYSSGLTQTMWAQGPSLTRVWDQVLVPYAARHASSFELGSDVLAIRNLPQQLMPVVRAAVARVNYQSLFFRSNADTAINTLAAGLQLSQTPFKELWGDAQHSADFDALHKQIVSHRFSLQSDLDQSLRQAAEKVVATVEKVAKVRPVTDGEINPVYTAVVCNDSEALALTADEWNARLTQHLQAYPIAGTQDLRSCMGWKRPANVTKPPISIMRDMDLLMLQSQWDGATPLEGAQATFEQLKGAHMVYVSGDIQHGIYLNADACVKKLVHAYLLGQSPTARVSQCEAPALPLDVVTR